MFAVKFAASVALKLRPAEDFRSASDPPRPEASAATAADSSGKAM